MAQVENVEAREETRVADAIPVSKYIVDSGIMIQD